MNRVTIVVMALLLGVAAAAQEASVLRVSGDFDGDGRSDTAEHRVGADSYQLIVWLGRAPQDQIVVLQGPRERSGDFLSVRPPGVYQPFPFGDADPAPVAIKHQAISYGSTESSESLIYWTDEGLRIIWLSD